MTPSPHVLPLFFLDVYHAAWLMVNYGAHVSAFYIHDELKVHSHLRLGRPTNRIAYFTVLLSIYEDIAML